MKFTQDWFSQNILNFEFVTDRIKPKSVLEIGCFEGRATCWMYQNMIPAGGKIVCVDTFKGGQEHADLDLSDLHARFMSNVIEARGHDQQLEVIPRTSFDALLLLLEWEKPLYDFIYVDASHQAKDVLADAVLAWRLLLPGGIMLFDDYGGGAQVKPAVDAFIRCNRDDLDVVISNYQVGVQKKISDNPNDA